MDFSRNTLGWKIIPTDELTPSIIFQRGRAKKNHQPGSCGTIVDPTNIDQMGSSGGPASGKIPERNGGFDHWEHHLFRLGPSIPWRTVSHNQRLIWQDPVENLLFFGWFAPLPWPHGHDCHRNGCNRLIRFIQIPNHHVDGFLNLSNMVLSWLCHGQKFIWLVGPTKKAGQYTHYKDSFLGWRTINE